MAGKKRDYYEVLGLSRDCSSSEIKQSYRRLARQFHPDVNNGNPQSEEKFKEISEAYAILSNEEKRRQYDAYGFSGNLFDGVNFESAFSEFGFGDIFNMFFGSTFSGGFSSTGPGSRRRFRGSDVILDTVIDFKEAAFGVEKNIEYMAEVECSHCSGTGAKSESDRMTCTVCGGSGQVRMSRDTFLGSLITNSVCSNCRGTGTVIKNPCAECGGNGYSRKKKKVTVNIPSGINSGDKLRVTGHGNSKGADSVPGDMIITVKVKSMPGFKREGDNVATSVDISFAQAALGTGLKVETLDGMEDIMIKPGTQPGTKIVLKSKGIVGMNSSRRGDHNIIVNVKIPKTLNEEEISLLKKYAQGRKEEVGNGSAGIFANLKNAFKR